MTDSENLRRTRNKHAVVAIGLVLATLAILKKRRAGRRAPAVQNRQETNVPATTPNRTSKPERFVRSCRLIPIISIVTCSILTLATLLSGPSWVLLPALICGLAAIFIVGYIPQNALHEEGTFEKQPDALCTPITPDARFHGVWVKDFKISESLDASCDAMHLNGLVRMAIRLVRGAEITIKTAENGKPVFELAVFSVFPWFKVRERYEVNGEASYWSRRDLRKGKHRGSAVLLPDGRLQVQLSWDDPYGGRGTDEFKLINDNELHVLSRLETKGGVSTSFNTIYRRKHKS